MLKLKRLAGEVLLLDNGHERVSIELEKVERGRVTLSITTVKRKGETFLFYLGEQSVHVNIEDITGRTSAVIAIDAPQKVRIWRAELVDHHSLSERRPVDQ